MTDQIVEPTEFLENWLAQNAKRLLQLKVIGKVTDDSGKNAEKYGAYIDLDSEARIGRLILWNTGDAETEVFDINTTERVYVDSRVVISEDEILLVLDKLLSNLI